MERNISVQLSLTWALLGTWPATQACALTRNQTDDPLVCRPMLNPLSHPSQGCLLFRFHIKVKSHGICLSLSGLFQLAQYPRGPSMLLQMERFHFFIAESYSIAYVYRYFFIHLCTDGYLDCLHIQATAMNIRMHMSF